MKCEEMRPLMSAYLHRELSSSERAWAQAHLNTCPLCHEEMAHLAAAGELLKDTLFTGAAAVVPAPDAWLRVQARLAGQPSTLKQRAQRASAHFTRALSTTIAGVVFIILAAFANQPKTAAPAPIAPVAAVQVAPLSAPEMQDMWAAKIEWRRDLSNARLAQSMTELRNTWRAVDETAVPALAEDAQPPNPRVCDVCDRKE